MNKFTKILLIVGVVLVLGGTGFYYFADNTDKSSTSSSNLPEESVTEYDDLLTQVMERKQESSLDASILAESNIESPIRFSNILRVGIRTNVGVIKAVDQSSQTLSKFAIKVNDVDAAIDSVMPIQLVKAFLLDGNQVLMFAISQGDNNCDVQYQILTVHDSKYRISKPFGTCLPLSSIVESGNSLKINIPQNNPYLGESISYVYLYENSQVKLSSSPSSKQIKQAFANYTATMIVNLAKKEGCYQDGVMLDSVSCGGGKRYCSMFKSLKANAVRDSSYLILKDFCS